MQPTIFVTGGAGYVGGDFLSLVQEKHSTYRVRALVRSQQQALLLKAQFPEVECVYGEGAVRERLVAEGRLADVVIQVASTDDEDLSFALLEGVAQHPGATYLHVSGIATLIDPSIPYGELDPKVFSDVAQTEELLHLPHDRLHASIEQDIIAKAEASGTKVAIVSLPRMYGKGRGKLTGESKVIEPYLRGVEARGRGFMAGAGRCVTSHAHVQDASSALMMLVEEALQGTSSKADWGRNGYYFVESGEGSFEKFATLVSRELERQKFIASTKVESLDDKDVAQVWEWGPKFWGSSSRSQADRLRGLGWQPSGIKEEETIGETIRSILGTRNAAE
ncbi:hypothetical protein NQ176_g9434 [Zarea fungicola]|uniref:Uncharacterized protein n=1 Tax=Zarea fungicola TaxID=93591 RepID=A0ACC1MMM0_9HYPO|nr:hypothetical protein NQ176_g9434 [Lecanicillium fungicola]